ncbi:hypothetical protein [Paraburkholderia phenazinium]|jgi:hypothetical protein|uniref:Uncharacterized protein n=1 Tax=Paraburkholderia phenazinium TaxID=60549 RepID=A0A1G7VUV0_9BURK|nr:hypothetical protein [Paraburkholderia phenazinium]SDG63605.1 hypothetical protein SAMN05216466_104262 [Paraburkholderia phenazinium]
MNASTQMLRRKLTCGTRRPRTVAIGALLSVLAAGAALPAAAQQVSQPGNLIIETDITPRDAFVPVPKSADPIAVQVETFPAATFDTALGAMASDLDLNGAHGTAGVAGSGALPGLTGSNGVGGLEHLLAGNGSGAPVGAGAGLGGAGGIGGSIAQSVNGALAPLGAAMGAIK